MVGKIHSSPRFQYFFYLLSRTFTPAFKELAKCCKVLRSDALLCFLALTLAVLSAKLWSDTSAYLLSY